MGIKKHNMNDLEKEMASVENDAVAEEQSNADKNYAYLDGELKSIIDSIPYPDVEPCSFGIDYDDRDEIQHEKHVNKPYWEKRDIISMYCNNGSLYSGHLLLPSKNIYIMDSHRTDTKCFNIDGEDVWLVNVDDRNYANWIKWWRYPSENKSIQFSRNITMDSRKVLDVDIILDKNKDLFSNISDAYLRKALIRNKDKTSVHSIIQTIQEKQDHIRSIPKEKSFIVQGCAGSGKTMVLLHRLRYLLYNKDIYSDDYVFLVPGNGFKGFIDEISTNFNISKRNILPYQEYYQNLSGKKPKTENLSDISELVFAPEYLERVYSKEFIKQSYQTLFSEISNQIEVLINFFENKFNELLDFEKLVIEEEIDSQKENTTKKIKEIVENIQPYVDVKINKYEDIISFINEVEAAYIKRKSEYDIANNLDVSIQISLDDERLLTNPLLQELRESISAENEAIKKASIFTVLSHKNKLKKLQEKYDLLLSEITKNLIEQEKKLYIEKASQLVYVYDNITLTDVASLLTLLQDLITEAEDKITNAQQILENPNEYLGKKFAVEIEKLNNLINISSEILNNDNSFVKTLTPSYEFFANTIKVGIELIDSFSLHITSKEKDYLKAELILFNERTDNQLYAYLNTMLFNACKKAIAKEFNIRICDAYKHYWYLDLYCAYLTKPLKAETHKYLFIDEAQDLSLSEIELLYKVNLNDKYPVLNLFGDTNQRITSHGISDWDNISIISNTYTLDENFRNTNQIVDYCNKRLSMNMVKIGVDMSEVSEYSNFEEAMENSNTLRNNPIFIVKDDYSVSDLTNLLSNIMSSGEYEIYTVKSAKGLEFKEVFVFDTDMTLNEKYISYTRALAKLNVIKNLPKTTDRTKTLIIQGAESEKIIESKEVINNEMFAEGGAMGDLVNSSSI